MKNNFSMPKVMLLLKWIIFLVTPIIGVLCIEYIVRGSFGLAKDWMIASPKMAIITALIYFSFQLIIFAILNNVVLATFITYVLWMVAAVVNFYKVKMMGDPVLPWDFMYANQLIDLIPALYKNVNLFALIGGAIISILVIYILVRKTLFKTFKWYIRLIIFAIGSIFLFFVYTFEDNKLSEVFKNNGIENTPWDQILTQRNNGMVLGFVINIPNIRVDKPEDYSKTTMKELEEKIETYSVHGDYETSDKKPNIVIIMSEAFWELSNIGVTLDGESVNPTVDSSKVGHIVSPRYGGGTSNVEFEALTGFSNAHLPGGAIPYQQYMGKNIYSLAWKVKNDGYKTTALHTYYKYFWNRIQAYESLGFDEFIGLDDIPDAPLFGSLYVDDKVITDKILNTIKNTDQPSFIYAVTMQNHGLYNDNRYGEDTIQAVNQYTDTTNQIINNLATGYKHSDEELSRLMQELEQLNEPTLVVFFGDHLPSMTEAYTETGFVSSVYSEDLEESLKTKQTPLVVWNNYGKEIEDVGNVSTTFLAPLIMRWAELESNGYINFLEEMRRNLPVYVSLLKQTSDGELRADTPEELKELEKMYQLLQYDMMFGEEYSAETVFK